MMPATKPYPHSDQLSPQAHSLLRRAPLIIALAILTACTTQTTPPESTLSEPEWNAKSWRTVIDDNCSSFFDGCNQCRRAEGAREAACTRKACLTYQKPVCLDDAQESQSK